MGFFVCAENLEVKLEAALRVRDVGSFMAAKEGEIDALRGCRLVRM